MEYEWFDLTYFNIKIILNITHSRVEAFRSKKNRKPRSKNYLGNSI